MEEDFRRIPTQSPLGPMSDMNSNFRNRDLSSTCGKCGQTNMTAIALIFWESFGQPRPTTQNRPSHAWCQVFVIFFDSLRKLCQPKWEISFKLYTYMFIHIPTILQNFQADSIICYFFLTNLLFFHPPKSFCIVFPPLSLIRAPPHISCQPC